MSFLKIFCGALWMILSLTVTPVSGEEDVFSIPGISFVPDQETTRYQKTYGILTAMESGKRVGFFAPLHLPHGGTVTQLSALVFDGTPTEGLTITLRNSANKIIWATMGTDRETTWEQPQVISTPTSVKIDMRSGSYYVHLKWTVPQTWDQIAVHRVGVYYSW